MAKKSDLPADLPSSLPCAKSNKLPFACARCICKVVNVAIAAVAREKSCLRDSPEYRSLLPASSFND